MIGILKRRRQLAMVCAGSLLFLSQSALADEPKRPSKIHEAAVARMYDDPNGAENVLRKGGTDTEKLDYALFLHAFRPHNSANRAKIKNLLKSIRNDIDSSGDFWGKSEVSPVEPYNGTDASLIKLIQAASMTEVGYTESAFYAIPCGVLQKRPKLLDATVPLYGGNGDNFLPRSGCQWGRGTVDGYPDAQVEQYLDLADRADGCIGCGMGTIRFTLGSEENLVRERARLAPKSFLYGENATLEPQQDYPYQAWSYLSISNRRLGRRIEQSYYIAREALTRYYRKIGLSPHEARHAAVKSLFGLPFGGNCGGNTAVKKSIRTLVLDGADDQKVAAFIASGVWKDQTRLAAIKACSVSGGVEPMAHIAVQNLAVFKNLQKLAQSVPEDQRAALDLQMDVNERDDLGKTPLMTAAQFSLEKSALYLLENGARVNDVTQLDVLHNDRRTALHYAAASASLPLIRLLVERGADIAAKDRLGASAGYDGSDVPGELTALDYLNGKGPVKESNPLSPEDRAEALRLLGEK